MPIPAFATTICLTALLAGCSKQHVGELVLPRLCFRSFRNVLPLKYDDIFSHLVKNDLRLQRSLRVSRAIIDLEYFQQLPVSFNTQ